MLIEKYREQIYNCGRCGYCLGAYSNHVCPSRFIAGFESTTARGRMLIARALLEQKLNYSPKLASMIFTCFLCGACDIKCHEAAKIKITDITKLMRADAIESGILLDKLIPVVKALHDSHNIYNESPSKRATLLGPNLIKGEYDLLYFPGCVATFRYPKIAHDTLQILKIAEIDFTLLGKEEWCCGNPFFFMGMFEEAEKFAMHNIEKIKEKGVKVVLTSCAGCYKMLSQEYPKILKDDLPFKVVHVTQFIDKLINEGYVKLKRSSHRKVTYHDPCEIGRFGGIYEEPRNIIQSVPNLKLVEMAKNRDNSWCCGWGGSVNIVHTGPALSVGELRVKQVEEIDVGTVVTACPSCVQMLGLASKRKHSKVRVIDIASFVLDALRSH